MDRLIADLSREGIDPPQLQIVCDRLPLVSVGGGEAIHDWFYLFSKAGLLEHDIAIARFVRFCGWLGMTGVVLWLAARTTTTHPDEEVAPW